MAARHRLVAGLAAGGPDRQAAGGVVEAAAQLGQAPAAHLPGRQLDGQRQPVEAGCRARRSRSSDGVPRRTGFEPAGAFDEQLGGGGAERFDGHEVLVAEPEGFTAGGEEPPGAAAGERGVDQLGGRIDHVLAVVQHDQHRPVGEVGAELRAGTGGVAFDTERIGHRPQHVSGGAGRHEIDEHRVLRPALDVVVADSQCDARLADTARTDQRDEPGLVELCRDHVDQVVPADQRRAQRREPTVE